VSTVAPDRAASPDAVVPVRVALAPALLDVLDGDDRGVVDAVSGAVEAVLDRLDLPGTCHAEVAARPSGSRLLELSLNGVRCRHPIRVLQSLQLEQPGADDAGEGSGAVPARRFSAPAAWTAAVQAHVAGLRSQPGGPSRARAWVAGLAGWLAGTTAALNPGRLVGPAQAAAVLGRAGTAGASGAVDPGTARAVIAGVLDLGLRVGDGTDLVRTLELGARTGASVLQVVEQVVRLAGRRDVSLQAHPDTLGRLTGLPAVERPLPLEQVPDGVLRDQLSYLLDSLQGDLDLPAPDIVVEPDPGMDPGWLTVRVQDQRGWAVPVQGSDRLLVAESARRLRHRGLVAEVVRHPYTGEEMAEVDATAAPVLEEAGVPSWGPGGAAAVILHLALRRRAGQLIGPAEVEQRLARTAVHQPDLVGLAAHVCTVTDLTRLLRALADEGIPVRDLPSILEHLALPDWPADVPAPVRAPDAVETDEERLARVRRGLRALVTEQCTGSRRALLALRPPQGWTDRVLALAALPQGDVGSAEEDERDALVDQLWEVGEAVSDARGRLVLLVPDKLRWPVRSLVAQEAAEWVVLADREVLPDVQTTLLPWQGSEVQVREQIVRDRVAALVHRAAGAAVEPASDGSLGFSVDGVPVTVAVRRWRDSSVIVTVSARPDVDLPATDDTCRRVATWAPDVGVHVTVAEQGGKLRLRCTSSLLGDFLDPEELGFAITVVVSAARELAAGDALPDPLQAPGDGAGGPVAR
jgi:hypothetical protein